LWPKEGEVGSGIHPSDVFIPISFFFTPYFSTSLKPFFHFALLFKRSLWKMGLKVLCGKIIGRKKRIIAVKKNGDKKNESAFHCGLIG